MEELFGLSMDVIMYVLLAMLVVSLISVAFVAATNWIMFKIGLRNIPRRRAQTTLIVIGLMLSTLIISAAFTTGDTVDRSMTSEVYGILGELDEVVELGGREEEDFEDPTQAVLRVRTFPEDTADELASALQGKEVIDFAIPAFSGVAIGINQTERLSTPEFNIVGLDLDYTGELGDIQTLGGRRLSLRDLGANELYLNESAADDMNASAGDSIIVAIGDRSTSFTVKDVVKDRRFAGAGGISVLREGAVVPLEVAQALFQAPGGVTMVMVSNRGDARAGYGYADEAEAEIAAVLATAKAGDPALNDLAVTTIKKTGVDIAELAANFLTTIFLVFGLFSIGAGVLLIFLIFVMLAAERKSEMGMARAIGTRRRDLVESFLSEGMAYNVLSAAVGCAFGVLVSFLLSQLMARVFDDLQIDITPHVTARSLIISYCLGVVLTFLTVTFSSWRVSNINIVRAIRDIPEPPQQKPMWASHGVMAVILNLLFRPTDRAGWLRRLGALGVFVLFILGFGFAPLLPVALSGAIALYVRWPRNAALLPGIGAVILRALWAPFRVVGEVVSIVQPGLLFLIVGILMTAQGDAMGDESFSAFFLAGGLSLIPLGLALLARALGANARIAYTLVGLFLIYLWELDNPIYDLVESVFGEMKGESLIERIFGPASGDIEMFFLSGVMVTLAATFLVVYNADLILGPLTRVGKGLGALLPTLKMAVAYPLANRTRTGMTMAMFCLVVFALAVMSSLSHNFERIALSDASLGGWDIVVDEHPSTPIGDLRAALQRANAPVASQIESIGGSLLATRFRAQACEQRPDNSCQQTLIAESGFEEYTVIGQDQAFLSNADIKLQSRAEGYGSDDAVWQALATEPNVAVIDLNALVDEGFGTGFIEEIDADDEVFQPVTITLFDRTTGLRADVKVIGLIDFNSGTLFNGIHVSQATFDGVFGEPDARQFYVKLGDGADSKESAQAIESALLESGVQAESLREIIRGFTAIQTGFFRMIQGFMGLGLVVGVAAVGVIAFRTVVERRQQIGMLRAIGYTRGMVGLTFLIESAFISFMGVLSGVVFALILAWQLITEEFAGQGAISFSVPWLQLAVICGFAFGFALVMTLIPARQAARIPIAQALRYE